MIQHGLKQVVNRTLQGAACLVFLVIPAAHAADEINGELGCANLESSCAYLQCICGLYGGDFEGRATTGDPDDGYCLCELADGVVFCADGLCRTFVLGRLVDAPNSGVSVEPVGDNAECQSLWCRLRMFVVRQQHGRIAAPVVAYDESRAPALAGVLPSIESNAAIFTVTHIPPVEEEPVAHPGIDMIEGGGHVEPPLQDEGSGIVDGLVVIAEPGEPEILIDPGMATDPVGEELRLICEGDHDGDGQADGFLEHYEEGAWGCCVNGYGCFVCASDYACEMVCDTTDCDEDQDALSDTRPALAGIDWDALHSSGNAHLPAGDDLPLAGLDPLLDADVANEALPDAGAFQGSRRSRRQQVRLRPRLVITNAITDTLVMP